MTNKETSWGHVADWYDEYLSLDTDSYHTKVVLPNLMRVMNILPTDRVLDLACGSGFFTKEFCKVSPNVVGLDISKELVDIAQKDLKEAHFIVSSADDLSDIKDGTINKIALVLAIQNIENVKKMFSECARVLVALGSIVIVMNHPTFRIPKKSSWGWDELQKKQYRRVDEYLSESKTSIDMHPGQKDKKETISFHRPLQYYFKLAFSAGFVATRFEEWISHKTSEKGPRKTEEDRTRKEIPLFLCLELRKNI